MLSLTASGRKVGIVDVTRGELSTRGNLTIRRKETDAATKILGLTCRENLAIADGNIELNIANKRKVISVIRRYKPEIVFAPYPDDRHPDHIHCGQLIRESAFYSGLEKIKIAGTKAYRPKKVYYYRNAYDMPVSFIYDISKEFQNKLKTIRCYSSQFYSGDSSGPVTFISTKLFDRDIEARARHFGFKIGAEFGEPFFSHEAVKADKDTLFKI